jgi:hypothetical protein
MVVFLLADKIRSGCFAKLCPLGGNCCDTARFPATPGRIGWRGCKASLSSAVFPDGHSFMALNRSAFITTVNDDNAIAAPANIGDIRMPDTG